MARLPEEIRQKYQSTEKSSNDRASRAERECAVLNGTPGNLHGYDCPACLNRGFVYVPNGDYVITRDCSCMDIRRSLMNVERSGIKQQLERCTFDNFYGFLQGARLGAVKHIFAQRCAGRFCDLALQSGICYGATKS